MGNEFVQLLSEDTQSEFDPQSIIFLTFSKNMVLFESCFGNIVHLQKDKGIV